MISMTMCADEQAGALEAPAPRRLHAPAGRARQRAKHGQARPAEREAGGAAKCLFVGCAGKDAEGRTKPYPRRRDSLRTRAATKRTTMTGGAKLIACGIHQRRRKQRKSQVTCSIV